MVNKVIRELKFVSGLLIFAGNCKVRIVTLKVTQQA